LGRPSPACLEASASFPIGASARRILCDHAEIGKDAVRLTTLTTGFPLALHSDNTFAISRRFASRFPIGDSTRRVLGDYTEIGEDAVRQTLTRLIQRQSWTLY
jgi:hypothetical protein